MNIALLQGSPNKTGSTALLCEQFTQGALASGHEVDRIDLAELSIAPVLAVCAVDTAPIPACNTTT